MFQMLHSNIFGPTWPRDSWWEDVMMTRIENGYITRVYRHRLSPVPPHFRPRPFLNSFAAL